MQHRTATAVVASVVLIVSMFVSMPVAQASQGSINYDCKTGALVGTFTNTEGVDLDIRLRNAQSGYQLGQRATVPSGQTRTVTVPRSELPASGTLTVYLDYASVGQHKWGVVRDFTFTICASTCDKYLFVGVRGSGQDDGFDRDIGNFIYRLERQATWRYAPGTSSITKHAVDYTAASVDVLKDLSAKQRALLAAGAVAGVAAPPLGSGPIAWALADYRASNYANFVGSIDSGISSFVTYLTNYHRQCRSTKIIVAGYSQGAMVVQRSLNRIEDNQQWSLLDRVAAVALIANGDKVPNTSTKVMGADGSGVAYWIRAYQRDVPSSLRARTVNVCTRGDEVCDFSAHSLRKPGSPHSEYANSVVMGNAAAWTAWTAVNYR